MAKFTVSGAATGSFQERSGVVCGFLVGATATTPGDVTIAQMESIVLNVDLNRKGQNNMSIVGAPVFPLVAATAPGSIGSTSVAIGNAGFSGAIDLGGFINLKDDDVLNININVGGTPATGATFTATTLFGVGLEIYTPQVVVGFVDKTRTTNNFSFNGEVSAMAIVNSSTAYVVTAASITSDQWNQQLATTEFDAMIGAQWNTSSPPYWGFRCYSGPELQRVDVTLTVNGSASGNAYVVAYAGQTSPITKARLSVANQKVETRLRKRYFGK